MGNMGVYDRWDEMGVRLVKTAVRLVETGVRLGETGVRLVATGVRLACSLADPNGTS